MNPSYELNGVSFINKDYVFVCMLHTLSVCVTCSVKIQMYSKKKDSNKCLFDCSMRWTIQMKAPLANMYRFSSHQSCTCILDSPVDTHLFDSNCGGGGGGVVGWE